MPVNTPDFSGCFESGFAAAVTALIDTLVPETRTSRPAIPRKRGRVNVLAGSALTVGDLEALKELIETFGLASVVVPDLADSLDGHLTEEEFNPLTYGGTTVAAITTLGNADATLVIGRSLEKAADLLHERTGVPEYRFDHLLGLEAVDALVYCLHRISGREVPKKLERQRAQLQDAMVDTHFMIGQTRVAIAADPDLLLGFAQCLTQMGAEIVAAVAPASGPALSSVPADHVQIGDLEDLEKTARQRRAEIVIGNSHAVDSAARLGATDRSGGLSAIRPHRRLSAHLHRLSGHAAASVRPREPAGRRARPRDSPVSLGLLAKAGRPYSRGEFPWPRPIPCG